MQNDCQQKQIQDLEWYRNLIAEIVESIFCPKCHVADSICIKTFPESGKACDAIFMCKQCGTNFTYKEIIKLAIEKYLGSKIFNYKIPDFVMCPICNEESYAPGEHICYLCGNEKQLTCSICGQDIQLEDIPIWVKYKKCNECNKSQYNGNEQRQSHD